MIFISILILIVAIALPSINKLISPILFTRISSIVFLYAGALSLNALYIQSIGSGISIYSGLFQVTTVFQLIDTFIFIIGFLILLALTNSPLGSGENRMSSIVLLCAGALFIYALYIRFIGSGIGIYSGLFQVTSTTILIPFMPSLPSLSLALKGKGQGRGSKLMNKDFINSAVFFNKNKSSLLFKGFHTSIALCADNKTLETALPKSDFDNTEELLKELAEMKENSEPLTIGEYLSETNSSFSEAFPNLNKFTLKDALSEINSDTNTNSIYNEPIIKEVLKPIYENPKSFLENKDDISKYLSIKNFSEGSYTALLNRLNENCKIEDITVESESDSPIVKYEEGQLKIDVKQAGLKIEKSIEYIIKHKDDFEINLSAIVPGVGALWMYRHVISAHSKYAFQDVSKLNISESAKKDYLKMQAKQVLMFNTVGAVLVVGSLYVISNTIMDQIRNKNVITVNTTGPQDPKVETSVKSIFMFTLFRKIKGPNWFKYLILLLILLIGLYFLISYFPNILFLYRSINVIWVKLVLVLITAIAILYNLISLLILIKFSNLDDKTIIIPQFLPNFILNYLIDLKRISKYDSINIFIQMYVTTTIFLFILLLLFLFVTNVLV